MTYKDRDVKKTHKKVLKKARFLNIDLRTLDFLDEIPHQLDGPRIPEIYDFGGKPTPFRGPLKRVL